MKRLMIGFMSVFSCMLSASQDQVAETERLHQEFVAFREHVGRTFDTIDQRLEALIARVDRLERHLTQLKPTLEQRRLALAASQARRQEEITAADAAGLSLREYRAGHY